MQPILDKYIRNILIIRMLYTKNRKISVLTLKKDTHS